MSQISVNPPPSRGEPVDPATDRTTTAGINLITVLIVLAVLAVSAWYLFTGPLRAVTNGSSTNVNVNPAPATVTVNTPAVATPASGATSQRANQASGYP